MKPKEFRAIRERMGLSQTELAELMGTNQNTVSRWEIGKCKISEPIARFLRLLDKTTRKGGKRK